MKSLRWFTALALSGLGLWFALRGVAWGEVRAAAAGARGSWALLAVPLVGLLEFLLRTERWRIILGVSPRDRRALFPTVAGAFFLNNILPFRAGEAARVYWTHRRTGRPLAACVAALAVDRLWDVFCVAALFLLAVAGGAAALSAPAAWGLLGTALGGFAFFIFLARHPGTVLSWTDRLRCPERLRKGLTVFVEGASGLKSPSAFAAAGLLSAALWGINVLVFQRVAGVFGLELSWFQGAGLLTGIALGVALPSTPGYLGTYEAAGVAALMLLGHGRSAAFAFVTVLHALQIAGTVLWGVPSLWRLGRPAPSDLDVKSPGRGRPLTEQR